MPLPFRIPPDASTPRATETGRPDGGSRGAANKKSSSDARKGIEGGSIVTAPGGWRGEDGDG
jgi:hypothetical protein